MPTTESTPIPAPALDPIPPTHVQVGASAVTVRALTIGEIRAAFQAIGRPENGELDLVGELLFEGVTLRELCLLTEGLSRVALEGLQPSQLWRLVDQVKAMNPEYFACRERLAALGAGQRQP